MKRDKKNCIIVLIIFLLVCSGIYCYKFMPTIANATQQSYIIFPGEEVETEVPLRSATMLYKNQTNTFVVYQYENEEVLLGALPWHEGDLLNENALFGINASGAPEEYLPLDRAQQNYTYSVAKVNSRTGNHSYVHLFFYTDVTLSNGENLRNVLLIMKEN